MTKRISRADVLRRGIEILRSTSAPTRWQAGRFMLALRCANSGFTSAANDAVGHMMLPLSCVEESERLPANPLRVALLACLVERAVVQASV